jgi:anti-anti-sigma factor
VTTTGDFDVRVTTAPGGRTVVHVIGDLDLATAPSLEDAVGDVEATSDIVLDLTGCSFLDSSGMRVLVGIRQRSAPDARVDLVASDAGVVRALQIARLDTMFSVHASLEDALEA